MNAKLCLGAKRLMNTTLETTTSKFTTTLLYLFLALVLAAMALVLVSRSAVAQEALPSDYHADTEYIISTTIPGTAGYTPGEKKGDTSPMYIVIKNLSGTIRLYGQGSSTRYGTYTDCMRGLGAPLAKGGTWRLRTNVREDYGGNAYGRIKGVNESGLFANMNGVFSPDSYNYSYKYLN